MANTKAPYGFRPNRYLGGSPWTGGGRQYYVPSSYAQNIFIGDPVTITGTGQATEIGGMPAGAFSTAALGLAGPNNLWVGICVGIIPVTRDSTIYHSAGTEGLIVVEDDPNVLFAVQDDGVATLGIGAVGLQANGIAGVGNTASGRSGWALDTAGSPPAANQAFQLTIIAGLRSVTNDITAPFAGWEVRLNKQLYDPISATGV